MADNYLLLAQGQLPTTVGALYSNTSGNNAIVRKIVLSNPSGAAATAKLHHVENAESPVDENVILPTRTLQDGDVTTQSVPIVVENNETIQGVSGTATAISYSIYGLEIVP